MSLAEPFETVPTPRAFAAMCDDFSRRSGKSRSWVSKKLFGDGVRIKEYASGERDANTGRLQRAVADLEALERELPPDQQRAADAAPAP